MQWLHLLTTAILARGAEIILEQPGVAECSLLRENLRLSYASRAFAGISPTSNAASSEGSTSIGSCFSRGESSSGATASSGDFWRETPNGNGPLCMETDEGEEAMQSPQSQPSQVSFLLRRQIADQIAEVTRTKIGLARHILDIQEDPLRALFGRHNAQELSRLMEEEDERRASWDQIMCRNCGQGLHTIFRPKYGSRSRSTMTGAKMKGMIRWIGFPSAGHDPEYHRRVFQALHELENDIGKDENQLMPLLDGIPAVLGSTFSPETEEERREANEMFPVRIPRMQRRALDFISRLQRVQKALGEENWEVELPIHFSLSELSQSAEARGATPDKTFFTYLDERALVEVGRHMRTWSEILFPQNNNDTATASPTPLAGRGWLERRVHVIRPRFSHAKMLHLFIEVLRSDTSMQPLQYLYEFEFASRSWDFRSLKLRMFYDLTLNYRVIQKGYYSRYSDRPQDRGTRECATVWIGTALGGHW
ncbi:unnamed protein product [Amoebophrya sp. A120]|nr:unnamed protein product [Amoebophrya sp. A120]|eukprot:GSA120T00005646001.1